MLIPFDILFPKYRIRSTTVVHLGANTGQEAESYARHGVKRVIWVEALPDIFAQLREHIAKYPGSQAILACLGDKDDELVKFNISSNEGQSSSFLEFGTHAQAHPNVSFVGAVEMFTSRLDTLFKHAHIQLESGCFLNIDLQGAELLALKGMGDLLSRFDYVYIEVNEKELYKGCPLVEEIDAYLFEYGFVGAETKMTNWGWGDKLFVRRKIEKND